MVYFFSSQCTFLQREHILAILSQIYALVGVLLQAEIMRNIRYGHNIKCCHQVSDPSALDVTVYHEGSDGGQFDWIEVDLIVAIIIILISVISVISILIVLIILIIITIISSIIMILVKLPLLVSC